MPGTRVVISRLLCARGSISSRRAKTISGAEWKRKGFTRQACFEVRSLTFGPLARIQGNHLQRLGGLTDIQVERNSTRHQE